MGYRTITADLLAAFIAFLKAGFTFRFMGSEGDERTADNCDYGKWDASTYSSAYIADIKEWLMDSDRCITEYEPLLTLRAQQA